MKQHFRFDYMFLLACMLGVVGCNRSNDTAISQAKAEAEAARTEVASQKARADLAAAELATVTAELAKLKAAKQEPAKTEVDDQDLKAAEWVVRVGGVVRVIAGGVQSEHPKDGKLPEAPLKVTFVSLIAPGEMNKLTNEGVKYLAGLRHLKELHIHPSGIDDFSFLTGLESLESFHGTFTDDGLARLKALTRIKELSIGNFFGNPKVTDAGLASVKELNNLETLGLSGCAITDAGLEQLGGLKNLKGLNLFRTQITDAGLQHLRGLNELRELHLVQTRVTGPGIEHLKGLPKLEFMNLRTGRKITSAILTVCYADRVGG